MMHQNFVRLFFSFMLSILVSCSGNRYLQNTSSFARKIKKIPEFEHSFTGLSVYNLHTGQYIINYNADKYFTPASNTKLFTYFSGLSVLGDTIPALRYKYVGKDSLVIWGTGNPVFLHHHVQDTAAAIFLKSVKSRIYLSKSNKNFYFFGSGWSWDDYNEYYSPEKSTLPIYGNVSTIIIDTNRSFSVDPPYMLNYFIEDSTIKTKSYYFQRDFRSNFIHYNILNVMKKDSLEIPFLWTDELFSSLMEDSLKITISKCDYNHLSGSKIIYSYPADSLYKKMLQPSDNFFAEQIMLMVSNQLFDTLDTRRVIQYVQDSLLTFISDKPRWVDGSGLSRYNLFTPRSFVELLRYLINNYPQKKLFNQLASAGKYGTMKNRFKQFKEPIFYGKTGTLSNNHNLSGYLLSKKGNILVFSFMMNHYRFPLKIMQKQMDAIISDLYYKY